MKKLLILIAILVLGQQVNAQKLVVDTSFMQNYCAANYNLMDGFFDKGKSPGRTTAGKKTTVYILPDLNAAPTRILEPFTHVALLKEGINPKTNKNWFKVGYQTRNKEGVYQDNEGYIIDENLSFGTVSINSETENLKFVLTESPLLDADLKMPRFRLNAINYLTNANYEKVKNTVTYDVPLNAVNAYNHFYLTSIPNIAFKNAPNLLRLYWHHGESCPESEGHVVMAYVNGKMTELLNTSSTGEGGFYESTKVYFPLQFAKGKTLFVENGDSKNMLDSYTGTLRTIPYPKDCGVPIQQLVVVIEEDAEGKTNAKGEFLEDKNKEIVMEITHKVIRYYKWDGQNLQQVKKIIVKQRKENLGQ